MFKKISGYFRGDRKYFAIVFFILVMIFVVGLVTPFLIENKKENWNEELSNKIIGIEEGIKAILYEKESQLIATKDQIKIELRNSLNVTDYEYGKLNSLVNRDDYKNYSLEIVAPNGKIIAWNNSPATEQESVARIFRKSASVFAVRVIALALSAEPAMNKRPTSVVEKSIPTL